MEKIPYFYVLCTVISSSICMGCARASPPKLSFHVDPAPQTMARRALSKSLMLSFQDRKKSLGISPVETLQGVEIESGDWDFGRPGTFVAVACDEKKGPLLMATSSFEPGQTQVDLTLSSIAENDPKDLCESPQESR